MQQTLCKQKCSRLVFSLLFLILSISIQPASGHEKKIQTNRTSKKVLPLPKEEDVFHFVIYGDRTGGPAEGIKVLEQAVKDTNLLDPDLVMTVGDLIQGYNQHDEWMKQMKEFQSTMKGLKMPWFPVAGNHDIYWRGPNKPEGEHEKSYEIYFGPLWYWFEHKGVGFLILYTDEGNLKTGQKAFGREGNDNFSDEQLKWLDGALKKLSKLDQVFVFMHHPRWIKNRYSKNNWDVVHKKLVEAKNVKAVFAGHIHRLHFDGKKNGIEYYALATTGGHVLGNYPEMGFVHHLNVVTVRKEKFSVSTIPVGQVFDPKKFTPEYLAEVDKVRHISPRLVSQPLKMSLEGSVAGIVSLEIKNPTPIKVEASLEVEDSTKDWVIFPDHTHVTVKPNSVQEVQFAVARDAGGKIVLPQLVYTSDAVTEEARFTLPPRKIRLSLEAQSVTDAYFQGTPDAQLLVSDRNSAIEVASNSFKLPQGALTLEAWVEPKSHPERSGIVNKTENSEYGFFMNSGQVYFMVFLDKDYISVNSTQRLPLNKRSHVAGVFDGAEIRLYIDGKLIAKKAAKGKRKTNGHPLFIGADTSGRGQPVDAFPGLIDEVRLSKVARYQGESFTPKNRFEPDTNSILLFHLDRSSNGFSFDRISKRGIGTHRGKVKIVPKLSN